MSEKNMAEVADKMVDKISIGVEKLASAFARLAPEIWEREVNYQLALGIVELIVEIGAIAACVTLFVWAFRKCGTSNEERYEVIAVIGGAIGAIVVGVALLNMPRSLATVVSPERAAARSLIGVVK